MNDEDEMKLPDYLGVHVSRLLEKAPFTGWKVKRSVVKGLPAKEVHYVFAKNRVELICGEDERIQTIFLHAGADEGLSGIPFALGRQAVLQRFGPPSKSGAPYQDPFLGANGGWDRFTSPSMTLHIKYRVASDAIDTITLMRPDVVP